MEFPDYHSSATKACVFICGIFIILYNGASGQDVTCNSVESATTNVFDTYYVTVSGVATGYNLTYEPAEYGPGMRLPLGTTGVTVTAVMSSSPSTEIGNCTFNVTVNLQELPIVCPRFLDLTVGTDPGQPFYTYPDPPFNIIYPPESMTYMPYGNITMVRQYGSSSSNDPRLDISPIPHVVTIVISDGTLAKSCNEVLVTVEEIDECLTTPCQNNGTCMDLFHDYNCACVPGYEGKNCENGSPTQVITKEASTTESSRNGVSTEASVPSSNSSKFPGMRSSDSFTSPSSLTLTNGPQTSSTGATSTSAIYRQSTGLIAALGALSVSLIYAIAIISVYIHYRRKISTATKVGTPNLYMDVKSRAKPDQSYEELALPSVVPKASSQRPGSITFNTPTSFP